MGNPQRQHFQAQAIQRNFIRAKKKKGKKGKLWMYDRETGEYDERTTEGIGWKRHLYSFSAGSKERYALEHAIAKLEDKASPIFLKLRKREEITANERGIIAEFIGLQVYRTPDSIGTLKTISDEGDVHILATIQEHLLSMSAEEYTAWIEDYEQKQGINLSELRDQESLRAILNSGTIEVKQSPEHLLKIMIDVSKQLRDEYLTRNWIVLHGVRGSSLVSSDMTTMPLTDGLDNTSKAVGPATQGMALYFPFARDCALVIRGSQGGRLSHETLTKDKVKQLNKGLAKRANQIYSDSKKLLESIVKSEGLEQPQQPKAYNHKLIKETSIAATKESFKS